MAATGAAGHRTRELLAADISDDLLALDEALDRLAARTTRRPNWSNCGILPG